MFVFNVSNKVCKLCVLLKLAVRNSRHRILLGCLTSEKNVMVQFGGRKNNVSVIKIINDQQIPVYQCNTIALINNLIKE